MTKILVVDDEKSILELLGVVFRKEGFEVRSDPGTPKAFDLVEEGDYDVLICDIKMPEIDGMDLLRRSKELRPMVPVVMITAYGSVKQAVEALRLGALDYVVKPFDVEELKIAVAHGLEERRLREENVLLKRAVRESGSFDNIIGKSRAMREIFSLIEKVADTESTVLISGESGTGKEVAARAIHSHSPRHDAPFVSVNCGALPENLLESELFGHVRGAFTGAVAETRGMFESARRGTIFLDEIGEMPPWTQVKLFRVLQDRKVRRVGGTEEVPVDVRIVAATNQDLKLRIEEGKFREELFYRLNVISFEMPPLRKRVEDIAPLAAHFLRKHCEKTGRPQKRITPEAMNALEVYSWPGNVRELENTIERIVAVEAREAITVASLPEEILGQGRRDIQASVGRGFNLEDHLDSVAKRFIQEAGERAGGNMSRMAELLGISYRSLRYLLEKYKIKSFGRVNSRSAANSGSGPEEL